MGQHVTEIRITAFPTLFRFGDLPSREAHVPAASKLGLELRTEERSVVADQDVCGRVLKRAAVE